MSTIRNPFFLFASKAISSLSNPAVSREVTDLEFGRIEGALSRPQNRDRTSADAFAPGGRAEPNLLFAYIKFVGTDDDGNDIRRLPIEVHQWFLERLASSPAVMSRRWRGRHADIFDPQHGREAETLSVDGVLVRPFVDLWHPVCRHLVVRALLSFDVYNQEDDHGELESVTHASQLWRWITRLDYEPPPSLRDLDEPTQVSLLSELTVILLDEAQLQRYGE